MEQRPCGATNKRSMDRNPKKIFVLLIVSKFFLKNCDLQLFFHRSNCDLQITFLLMDLLNHEQFSLSYIWWRRGFVVWSLIKCFRPINSYDYKTHDSAEFAVTGSAYYKKKLLFLIYEQLLLIRINTEIYIR